jgi:phosphatidylserine/phosphatidylglycerophosphate/cardiolipin synthase-like enzyme
MVYRRNKILIFILRDKYYQGKIEVKKMRLEHFHRREIMGRWLLNLSLVLFTLFFACNVRAEDLTLDHSKIEVFFSPDGGCIEAIVNQVDNAKSEVLIQAYSFTLKNIANALVRASERHVKVEVILDLSQRTEKHSMRVFLARSGIPVYIDAKHSTAHNKIMIIDESIVATGSCNYIKAAENENAENLLIIHSKDLASLYKANWEKHKSHSEVVVH